MRSAPKDQRAASAYLFDAICPKLGKGAALVLPRGNIAAMNLNLQEIAAEVAPFVGATIHRIVPSSCSPHAVLLLDQGGWRTSAKLAATPNITLMPLPPKAPKLNPVENLWQFICDKWLSNRILQSCDDILDHACAAWNRISPFRRPVIRLSVPNAALRQNTLQMLARLACDTHRRRGRTSCGLARDRD